MEDEEFFFLIKKEKTKSEGYDRKRQRRKGEMHRRQGGMKNGKPEALDEIIIGVPEEKRPVLKRKDIKRVDDRCRIEKNLEEYRHDVLDVTDSDMGHGGDERKTPGKKEMKADGHRNKEQAPGEGRFKNGHEAEKDED